MTLLNRYFLKIFNPISILERAEGGLDVMSILNSIVTILKNTF